VISLTNDFNVLYEFETGLVHVTLLVSEQHKKGQLSEQSERSEASTAEMRANESQFSDVGESVEIELDVDEHDPSGDAAGQHILEAEPERETQSEKKAPSPKKDSELEAVNVEDVTSQAQLEKKLSPKKTPKKIEVESVGSEEDTDNRVERKEKEEASEKPKETTPEKSGMTIHEDGRVTFEKYSDESPDDQSSDVTSELTAVPQHIKRATPPDSPSPPAEPALTSTPKDPGPDAKAVDEFVGSGGDLEGDNSINLTLLNKTDVTLTPGELGSQLAKRDRAAMSPGLLQEEMRRLEMMAGEGEDNIELQADKLG
jgi:hypothetical protein